MVVSTREVQRRVQVRPEYRRAATADPRVHVRVRRGHDTAIGGGRVVHFVRGADVAPQDHTLSAGLTPHESKPCDAIPYEIARPNLTELRVRVYNQFGKAAGMQYSFNIPGSFSNTANELENIETALPDWFMVIQLEPVEKNMYDR